jgi:hypothetical protein
MIGEYVHLTEWELAGEIKVFRENVPHATFPTTNPTWPHMGSNPGHDNGKPAINCLNYGTAPTLLNLTDIIEQLDTQ